MDNIEPDEIPRFTHTSKGGDQKMRSRSFRTIDMKKRTNELELNEIMKELNLNQLKSNNPYH